MPSRNGHTPCEKGFTLVELAVVLFITAVIMASVVAMMKPYLESVRVSSTQKKMDAISDTLASYARVYGRLPCPARTTPGTEPYGAPVNSGVNGANQIKAVGCSGTNIGIIPFAALQMKEDDARDGYGNYFTYAVNPAMTQFDADPADVDPASDAGLQSDCTSTTWKTSGSNSINKNIYKAHVCCAIEDPAQTIQIMDSKAGGKNLFTQNQAGGNGAPNQWETYSQAVTAGTQNDDQSKYDFRSCSPPISDCQGEGANCSYVGDSNSPECHQYDQCVADNLPPGNTWATNPTVTGSGQGGALTTSYEYCSERQLKGGGAVTNTNSFIAYVLISHGTNGDAAFVRNSAPRAVTAPNGAEEAENRNPNPDLVFVSEPRSTSMDNNYFDDVVRWETNDQLISHYNDNSCVRP